jgi:DNA modification methylase
MWRPGLVLDPFMGAGTTGVVAKGLGRDWLGIELNPEYWALALTRIANSGGARRTEERG